MQSMTIATINLVRAGTAAFHIPTRFAVRPTTVCVVASNGALDAGEKSALSTYGTTLARSGRGPWSTPD